MSKIEDAELNEINELRTKLTKTVNNVGQYTLQIKLLQQNIKELENTIEQENTAFQQLLEEEKQLVNRLSEKYGTGSIDFETGEFTPEK